nr:MAG TPA: hypothetical protein [Caudoviricetes sp.]
MRVFSSSTIPNMQQIAAFCHNSSLIKSLRPLLWWQKFSINFIALFACFALK